ncbi:ShTK domain protein [Trichostrongylus colubriformis]|uniref:ShTK domain protein n=1 Tax=Trichostrongylus colubriformis TaxID=6319 RepID=A0AAN8FKP9_TRICO
MVVDPAVSGMCVDTNMQCPVWASTGQCATNGLMMRRMCALSCGTCALGMEYGMGMGMGMGAPGLGYGLGTGLGAASVGYAGTGLNPLATPLLGRSIYEQGILRSPPRSTIYPRNMKKDKLSDLSPVSA